MSSKRKLCEAIIEQGALRAEDLRAEFIEADEYGEYWRVSLRRDVSFPWGGVERTLPAGTELGEVDIYPEDGETAEDVSYQFISHPNLYLHSVEQLEREMLDAE